MLNLPQACRQLISNRYIVLFVLFLLYLPTFSNCVIFLNLGCSKVKKFGVSTYLGTTYLPIYLKTYSKPCFCNLKKFTDLTIRLEPKVVHLSN